MESLYSILENIKNGRLDSTFYGRFKRLRFKSPHLIVFTNNVPNMSALSSDRFNLLAITDRMHRYTVVKCDVSLKMTIIVILLLRGTIKRKLVAVKIKKVFIKNRGHVRG